MTDSVWTFARFAADFRVEDAPPALIARAKTFLLDSLGVGVVGSAAPWVDALVGAEQALYGDGPARALASGVRLAAPSAALVNAFQMHNSEFDCVHEAAVVHAFTCPLAALLAHVDSRERASGRDLLAALIVGVEVACALGLASKAAMRFFRPATAGGLGAAAALAKLRGLDAAGVVAAMSAAFAQLGGAMQAHSEGKALLPMQMGFNARNALLAAELAARGVETPENVLEGPYGYFPLYEGAHAADSVAQTLGRTWRILEMAHKPFPSGRATHGLIDAVLKLRDRHGFAAADVAKVEGRLPSLTHRLIGRPPRPDMTPNYARLCGRYAVASALVSGDVGIPDFQDAAIHDPARLALADKVGLTVDDNPDPNALTPITVAVTLDGGKRLEISLTTVYGGPADPMTETAHLEKFRRNCAAGRPGLPEGQAEALIAAVDGIEALDDARRLIDLAVAPA